MIIGEKKREGGINTMEEKRSLEQADSLISTGAGAGGAYNKFSGNSFKNSKSALDDDD